MNKKCLYCSKKLIENETDFHSKCSKAFFGSVSAPVLDYHQKDLLQLAEKVINSHQTITGVQPKLSLGIQKKDKNNPVERLTIVGLWGRYILKPQTELYPELPELENLTMRLARISGITTVDNSLIRLKSGELSYITQRIDRIKNKKNHMEDMCQLTERLTEHKYKGSYEQIGKVILKYSANPVFDAISFFEEILFCFLTGNNDMHLKNFSLIKTDFNNYKLSPAYDLISSTLVIPEDDEETALTLNGKKRKLNPEDFKSLGNSLKISSKTQERIFSTYRQKTEKWPEEIENSFLSDSMKEKYKNLVASRLERLF